MVLYRFKALFDKKGVRMGKNLKGKEIGEGIYQLASKKYCARVSGFGKRIAKTFDSLQEARIWVAERRMRTTPLVFSDDMTLNEWYEYWIDNIKLPSVKIGTYELYCRIYRIHIRDTLGYMRLHEIKPLDCNNLIISKSKKLGRSSIEHIYYCLSQLMESAVENELIDHTPVKPLKLKSETKEERRVFTAQEQENFCEYIKKHKFKYRDECLFVLETGLRIGELLGLKWSDVDFSQRKIEVKRSMCYVVSQKRYIEVEPKTSSGVRTIPLTDKAYHILKNRKITGISYIFLDISRRTRVGLDPPMGTVCKHLGIEKISIHGLRHSFATRCIEAGMKPKVLQKILGHSTLSMTMDLYVHVTEEILFQEMKKLG